MTKDIILSSETLLNSSKTL